MLAQQPIAWEQNQAHIGKTVDVLIEQENPATGHIGRSARFAPEVDGLVYVTGAAPLNQIVPVTITAADTYDLFGEVTAVAPPEPSLSLTHDRLTARSLPPFTPFVHLFEDHPMTFSFASLGLSAPALAI
jgi:hypothetical protein